MLVGSRKEEKICTTSLRGGKNTALTVGLISAVRTAMAQVSRRRRRKFGNDVAAILIRVVVIVAIADAS